MALNWSIKETEALAEMSDLEDASNETRANTGEDDADALNRLDTLRAQRDAIIWATLVTGFPGKAWKITERNVDEMRMRCVTYWKLNEPTALSLFDDLREDFAKFINLTTNAGSVSDSAFWAHIRRIQRRNFGLAK